MSEPLVQPSPEAVQTHRELWIEVIVVSLVCIAPSILNSILPHYLSAVAHYGSWVEYDLNSLLRRIACIALILFIVRKSGSRSSYFGIRPFRFNADILGAIFLFAFTYSLQWLIYRTLAPSPHRVSPAAAMETNRIVLWAFTSLGIGFSEELFARGYLITRFEELFESKLAAVVLSSAIFFAAHLHVTLAGSIDNFLYSLIMAIAFIKFRRLMPLALSHALFDFVATVWR